MSELNNVTVMDIPTETLDAMVDAANELAAETQNVTDVANTVGETAEIIQKTSGLSTGTKVAIGVGAGLTAGAVIFELTPFGRKVTKKALDDLSAWWENQKYERKCKKALKKTRKERIKYLKENKDVTGDDIDVPADLPVV